MYNYRTEVYNNFMTATYTTFTAGHTTHASVETGITVCGKRTETLESASGHPTCAYCSDRVTVHTGLNALTAAIRGTR